MNFLIDIYYPLLLISQFLILNHWRNIVDAGVVKANDKNQRSFLIIDHTTINDFCVVKILRLFGG